MRFLTNSIISDGGLLSFFCARKIGIITVQISIKLYAEWLNIRAVAEESARGACALQGSWIFLHEKGGAAKVGQHAGVTLGAAALLFVAGAFLSFQGYRGEWRPMGERRRSVPRAPRRACQRGGRALWPLAARCG